MKIVLYDDQMGMQAPMGWDEDCEGAICSFVKDIALFDSTAEARKAIAISTRWAELQKAQGKPHNEDFTTCKMHLRIVPLRRKGGAK